MCIRDSLKDLGSHDYTLKNLMYENHCCKFYDAVDENNTSYVLKFIPSDMTLDGDILPFIDYFQVKQGLFLVYASNNFAKEGTDYFTYSGSSEKKVSIPNTALGTEKKLQFIETDHPKFQKLTKKQQDTKNSTSKKSVVTNHFSGKKTPNPGPKSLDELKGEINVGISNIKSNTKNTSKIRSEKFVSCLIETKHTPGLASILSKDGTAYPSNTNGGHISIVHPTLQIYHSSHKQIVKTPAPKGSISPVERCSLKEGNFKCFSPRPLEHGNPKCDFQNNMELRLLESSMLQRRQSTQNI